MKALIQRVKQAQVTVDDRQVSAIGPGILVLLGVQDGDTEKDAEYLVEKIVHLRIFEDDQGKMNWGTAAKAGGPRSPGRPRRIRRNSCTIISLKKQKNPAFPLPAAHSRRSWKCR
jgi:hypothetical protein